MKLRSVFAALHAALLCILLAASPAGSGSMTLLGVGKAGGAALPGPPVFTQTAFTGGSVAGNVATSGSLSIGAANANRRVYVLIFSGNQATPVSATFNTGAISADVVQQLGTTAIDAGLSINLFSAVVPAGTTCTIEATFGSTASATSFGAFTVDTTTLVGIAPVVTAQSAVTAATANPVSANTFGIATSTAGSAILAGFYGFGITNGSQSFTSSDATVSTDATFGSTMLGHANSAPVSASSRVNTGWTTTGDSLLALAVFR